MGDGLEEAPGRTDRCPGGSAGPPPSLAPWPGVPTFLSCLRLLERMAASSWSREFFSWAGRALSPIFRWVAGDSEFLRFSMMSGGARGGGGGGGAAGAPPLPGEFLGAALGGGCREGLGEPRAGVWQALAGHKRSFPRAVVLPPPARGNPVGEGTK